MHHIDPADLAVHALDGDAADLPARQAAHLRTCAVCAGEWEALRRVVRAGRTAGAAEGPVPPPPEVWLAVLAELAEDRAGPDGTHPR